MQWLQIMVSIAAVTVATVVVVAVAKSLGGEFRRGRQRYYIDNYSFPDGLMAKLKKRRPELGEEQWRRVLRGLKEYFAVCNLAQRRLVAMPSQVVDDAWHEFILFTRPYHRFCQRAFGRYLHHTPAEAMGSAGDAEEGIKRAWRLACQREGIDPAEPTRLPLLFALDSELNIQEGYRYTLNCGRQIGRGQPYCAAHIGCTSCTADGGGDDGVLDAGGCGGDAGCGGD